MTQQSYRTPITWNGKRYTSLIAAARANFITASTMCWRIRSGYTSDAEMPFKAMRPVTWNDIEYKSLTAAARANHVHKTTMHDYLAKGYVCDDDVPGIGNPQSCVWNGVQYDSITIAARANDVPRYTMQYRIRTRGYACDCDFAARQTVHCEHKDTDS